MKKRYGFALCLIFFIHTVSFAKELQTVEQTALLKERFRVDYLIETITLIVHRKFGSEPVVLIQPDGSKWYSSRFPENVKWASGEVGDIIKIYEPMSGPWQIVGDIEPNSYIKIYSKTGVSIEEFPPQLFKGEILKVTANLFGEQLPIRMKGLDYLIDWTVRLINEEKLRESENAPSSSIDQEQANFETGTLTIGSYKDDGAGLDERPDDGDFTGQLKLDHKPGTYLLQVELVNEIFARQYQQYIEILPKPIQINYESLEMESGLTSWFVKIKVDDKVLKVNETHLKLILQDADQSLQEIMMQDVYAGETLFPLPSVGEVGNYRIDGQVFATTYNGRELMFELDPVLFSIDPIPVVLSPEEIEAEKERKRIEAEEKRIATDTIYRIHLDLQKIFKEVMKLIDAASNSNVDLDEKEKLNREAVVLFIVINLASFLALAVLIPAFIPRIKKGKSKSSK
tara:strand:- start:251 stop:1618 length:1368 start_codon:yes stop_codon:yes gene_type:complete